MAKTPDARKPTESDGATEDDYTPGDVGAWISAWLIDPHRERTKFSDIGMLVLTAVIAAVALWTARIFNDQLTQMSQQTRILRDDAIIGKRPWIGVDTNIAFQHPNPLLPPGIPLTFAFQDTPIPVNFPFYSTIGVKNFGQSPALHVYPFIETKWIDFPQGTPSQITPPSIAECAEGTPYRRTREEALFPNAVYTYSSVPEIAGKPIIDKMRGLRNAYFVFGCIRYKDSFNLDKPEFYQTNFCRYYWLGDTPHRWQPCDAGNSVR